MLWKMIFYYVIIFLGWWFDFKYVITDIPLFFTEINRQGDDMSADNLGRDEHDPSCCDNTTEVVL